MTLNTPGALATREVTTPPTSDPSVCTRISIRKMLPGAASTKVFVGFGVAFREITPDWLDFPDHYRPPAHSALRSHWNRPPSSLRRRPALPARRNHWATNRRHRP